jgi:hypothetical protein
MRFQVLIPMSMNMAVVLDVAPCGLIDIDRRAYCMSASLGRIASQKTAKFSTFLLFVIMRDTKELSYLEIHSVEEHEDESQRPSCFVGTMRP